MGGLGFLLFSFHVESCSYFGLELYMQVVEVLNPLAREYKSIGTLEKDLAGLQEELAEAHRQVNI